MTKRWMLCCFMLWACAANAEPVRIVAFGGSNTFGKNLSRSEAYPAQLEALLKARGHDVVVINEGTNGQTTADELGKLGDAVPEGTKIVIFQPGGNDKRRGSHNTLVNIETIVQQLTDRNIAILFSGGVNKRAAVARFNVRTVDEINQLAPESLQPDGQHLTAAGYRAVAEKLLPLVEELLEAVKVK